MKITQRLDRHSLELVIGVALLGVGLTVLFPLLGVVGLIPPTDTRAVELDDRTRAPGGTTGETSLRGTHDAELVVSDPALLDRVLLTGPEIIQGILILVVLTLAMRIATTLRADGAIFVPQNPRRLYGIAVTLLLTATLVPGLDVVTTMALVNGTPLDATVEIAYQLSGTTLLLSFLAAGLAGAFAYGTRLRDDTEGLV
ncbi:DUF2975 domain-containing protein [Actinomadura welshii]